MAMWVQDDEQSECQLVISWIETNVLLRKQADFHRVLYYEMNVMKPLNQKAIRVL